MCVCLCHIIGAFLFTITAAAHQLLACVTELYMRVCLCHIIDAFLFTVTAAAHQLLACVSECAHVKELLLKGNDIKADDGGTRAWDKLNEILAQRRILASDVAAKS